MDLTSSSRNNDHVGEHSNAINRTFLLLLDLLLLPAITLSVCSLSFPLHAATCEYIKQTDLLLITFPWMNSMRGLDLVILIVIVNQRVDLRVDRQVVVRGMRALRTVALGKQDNHHVLIMINKKQPLSATVYPSQPQDQHESMFLLASHS